MPNAHDMNKNQNSKENTEKLHNKIKETWSGLNDQDVKLYEENRDQFFAKVQEKQKVSKVDAQKKLEQLEKDCGCSSMKKAA